MLRRLAAEQGSIPVLLVWITMGFILLIAISYDFLAVFVARRVSQKAADAAVIGAAEKWHEQAERDGQAEAQARLQRFLAAMHEAVERAVADWEKVQDPDADPEEIARWREAYREERREAYIRGHIRTAAVRGALLQNRTTSVTQLIHEFISPQDAGCIAYAAGSSANGMMQHVSAFYVRENGADGQHEVRYPVSVSGSPRVEVIAARRLRLGIFDYALDEAHRNVRARAYATISRVGPVAIQWSPGCGGS